MKKTSRRPSPKAVPLESPAALQARLEAFALKTREESIRHKAMVDNGLVDLDMEHGILVGPPPPKPRTTKRK